MPFRRAKTLFVLWKILLKVLRFHILTHWVKVWIAREISSGWACHESDDAEEGGVGEPDGFETKGSLAVIKGEWVCVDKDRVVVKRSSRKVEDICFFKKEFPVRVGKNSIETLHNKAYVSFVCPSKAGSIVAEVNEVS